LGCEVLRDRVTRLARTARPTSGWVFS